jgi:hypothetical protein
MSNLYEHLIQLNGPGTYIPEYGGYYAGIIHIPNIIRYMIFVSPKEYEMSKIPFSFKIPNKALCNYSFWNGLENTKNVIEFSNFETPAHYCRNLIINGLSDWYLPAKDELEICYRFLKPGNTFSFKTYDRLEFKSGENLNSDPINLDYDELFPIKSRFTIMNETNYWSSTNANKHLEQFQVGQNFCNGIQFTKYKTNKYNVRPIRREVISCNV